MFDYRRSRRRQKGQYAEFGILAMQAQRAESEVSKLKARAQVIEHV
jgi:hypothetical protein